MFDDALVITTPVIARKLSNYERKGQIVQCYFNAYTYIPIRTLKRNVAVTRDLLKRANANFQVRIVFLKLRIR